MRRVLGDRWRSLALRNCAENKVFGRAGRSFARADTSIAGDAPSTESDHHGRCAAPGDLAPRPSGRASESEISDA